MPYNPNDPNYQTKSSRVVTFNDFEENIDKEKEELKKVKRSYINNNTEDTQIIGNPKYKYNKVTHKIDTLSKSEVEDDLDAIEDIGHDKEHKYKIVESSEETYTSKILSNGFLNSTKEELDELIHKVIQDDIVDFENGMPLRACLRHDRLDLIKLLVDSGADISIRRNMIIKLACENGKTKALNFLLNNIKLSNSEFQELLHWTKTSSKITKEDIDKIINILEHELNHKNEGYKIVESLETKLEAEGVFRVDKREDGGQSLIAESIHFDTSNSDEENGMFITIQSCDENKSHTDFKSLVGKQVKITIEIL